MMLKSLFILKKFCISKENLINKHFKISNLESTIYSKIKDNYTRYLDIFNQVTNNIEQKDDKELEALRKELIYYSKYYNYFNNIIKIEKDLKEYDELKNDPELKELLESDFEENKLEFDSIINKSKLLLVPKEQYDEMNTCFMEFKPGAGGSESSLFASEMINIYSNYCMSKGYNCKTIDLIKNPGGKGIKFGKLKITGEGCFYNLKNESGVHKVIRVPETEAKGRLHSSAISIIILPEVPFNFSIKNSDLKIIFTKAQGAGGQHVNTTDSACKVSHIPTGITVSIQEDRCQHKNKKLALEIIHQRVYEHDFEIFNEKMKLLKSNQITGTDRSDKIRTYNFQASRITDHRLGYSINNIKLLDSGEAFDIFIKEIQEYNANNYLNSLN